MGVLKKGNRSLKWHASKKYHAYVKRHGLLQFLHVYQNCKDQQGVEFLWGDEVEHIVTVVQGQDVKLNLRAERVMEQLQHQMQLIQKADGSDVRTATFHAEYGCFMIETTPSKPYGGMTTDLRRVQRNMTMRRQLIQEFLAPNERVMNISAFPLMGVGDFALDPEGKENEELPEGQEVRSNVAPGPIIKSRTIPDTVINSHPRFATLTRNIRRRRGQTVCIRMPLFQDKNTPEFQQPASQPESAEGKEGEIKPCGCRIPSSGHALNCCDLCPEESGSECRALPCPGPQHQMYAGRHAIHMDAMAFGMGCCCLQTTFQARHLEESRYLYDQLAVLAPIMLAATASTPFLKGRIADTDARWNVIVQAVDDRQPEELGLAKHLCSDHLTDTPEQLAAEEEQEREEQRLWEEELARKAERKRMIQSGELSEVEESGSDDEDDDILEVPPEAELEIKEQEEAEAENKTPRVRQYKSRYDSISYYISNSPRLKKEYNDVPACVDPRTYKMLKDAGVDHLLSQHIAHLWTRDPLVIFEDRLFSERDDSSFFHFDNIQSTNWQTVRWKPPAPASKGDEAQPSGWKVEFRTMEIQLTDFENAAYTCFIALLSRAILLFDLNLYVPMTKVDENLQIAHKRDAARKEKFWFRKEVVDPTSAKKVCGQPQEAAVADDPAPSIESESELMTLDEILNGRPGGFPGLINFVQAYLDVIKCDKKTRLVMNSYMELISKRASGELLTTATWLREFVSRHPLYKADSHLSPELVHELLEVCHKISSGDLEAPQLHGKLVSHISVDTDDNEITPEEPADSQQKSSQPRQRNLSRREEDVARYLRGASFVVDLDNPQSIEEFRQVLQKNKIQVCDSESAQVPKEE